MTADVSRARRWAQRRAQLRLVVMVVIGFVVGALVSSLTEVASGLVAGWAAASAVYVVWVWAVVGRFDAASTKTHATREDPGRAISDFLVIAASIASLGAVALLLIGGHTRHGLDRNVVATVAVVSVALSWLLIHTLYSLRYAREYYTEPVGGIDFNNPDEPPKYSDFAYLAFDLGQTFQISDTALRTSKLRSIVLRHTLLSYVFSTVVLATVVNLVVGLGGS